MTDKKPEHGGKVLYTDANGREREARVDYVWERFERPLINLSYNDDGERVVATSVPHKDAVKGARGYFYDLPEPKTLYIQIDAAPGDYLVILNRRNNYTTKLRVPKPPPTHDSSCPAPADVPWSELHAVKR